MKIRRPGVVYTGSPYTEPTGTSEEMLALTKSAKTGFQRFVDISR